MPRHFVPILFLVAAVSLPNLLRADAHEAEADQQFEEAVTAVHDKAYRKALRLFKDLA